MFYGRNFDWDYSPALLLFTDPPGGYASVSMVDIAYLGIEGKSAKTLLNLPFEERQLLLDAPSLPFDGMNERGLVIGMAAVPPGQMLPDPARVTIGSLLVIRNILDHARDVNEAVTIIQSYNIDMEGGPPLHYLIADASGKAVLVGFHRGEMVVIPNEKPWLQATNFLQTASNDTGEGQCWRFDRLFQQLNMVDGKVTIL
jgi:penicillin V acylase-like amidase (Ntn superfamily)